MQDKNKNYAERVAKGTIIVFITTIISAFIGYLLRTYMARSLTVAEYGIFYTVFVFIAFLLTFRDLGMNQASVKFIPEFIVKKKYDKIKSLLVFSMLFQLAFSFIIACTIFALGNYLCLYFFKNPLASEILPLLLVFFVINAVFYICRFAFQGFQKFKYLAFADFLYIASSMLSILALFLFLGPSIVNAAYGYVIGAFISSIICIFLLVRTFPQIIHGDFNFDRDLIKKFILFSGAIILFFSSNYIMVNIDTLTIAFFEGSEAAGLYQVAAPIAQIVIYVAVAIEAAVFPFISEIWARRKYEMISKSRSLLLKLSFIATVPICLVLISFPEIVINILFGSKYLGATDPLRILSMGFLFFNLGILSVAILNGMGKPMINTKIVIFAAVFNLIANIIMVPIYGLVGAAIATTTAYFIFLSLGQHFLNREFRLQKICYIVPYGSLLKAFIGGVFTLAIIFSLKSIMLLDVFPKFFAILISSMLFYGIWILCTKCINSEDIQILKSMNLPIPKSIMDMVENIVS